LSIHSLDLLKNRDLKSFVIGASNQLFHQENVFDVIITNADEDFLIFNSQLKNDLQLTTADLRFFQSLQTNTNEFKNEQELRELFVNYLLCLLSVAKAPSLSFVVDFIQS